jgi:very-short-patch-repair endonuclease
MKEKLTITDLARQLRRNMTEAERLLWQELRNRKLGGFKFNRQFPVVYREIYGKKDFFILDFYCAEKKIAVELDGPIHDKQKDYDQSRDQILQEVGISVIRYKNEEVKQMERLLNNLIEILNSIEIK